MREVKVLGDRILSRSIRSKDTDYYILGRYMQILFDGHPDLQEQAINAAKESFDYLYAKCYRVPDFLDEGVLHKRSLKLVSPVYDSKTRDEAYYRTLNSMLKENPSKL